MPNFGIAIGWNAAEEDIEDFVPYQPLTPGFQWTRRTDTVTDVIDEGPFILFTWGLMDEVQYQAMLTQAGVFTLRVCNVTIKAQDENYSWTFFNGEAVKPQNAGRHGYHLNNVPLLVRGLFQAAT